MLSLRRPPAGVEAKTNRITVLLDSGVALPGPPSFEALSAVLRADGPGPEAINGRLAMIAFFATAGVELATGQSLLSQLASGPGAAAAAGLAAAVAAASLAPAYTGAKRVQEVFPSTNDSYPNSQLVRRSLERLGLRVRGAKFPVRCTGMPRCMGPRPAGLTSAAGSRS